MKKLIVLLMLLYCSFTAAFIGNPCWIPQARDPIICYYDELEFRSESFMYTRPVIEDLARQLAFWHDLIYNKDACRPALQGTAFVQCSVSNAKVARYFLIDKKNELLVTGDAYPLAPVRDVRAEWLGINNDSFYGTLTLNPHQKQFGFELEAYFPFEGVCKATTMLDNWWLAVRMPVVYVENDIRLRQDRVQNIGTGAAFDIISAFNQSAWHAARMVGKQHRVGLAEINMRVGSTYLDSDYFEFGYYSGVSFPTTGPQNACNIFHPYAGRNGHFCIDSGINMQIPLNSCTQVYAIGWFIDLEVRWFLRERQCRTFDLRHKQWSRYLLFNQLDGFQIRNIPGVNILTREVWVDPYGIVDFSTGWRYIDDRIEGEVGYSLWGHGNEHLRLIHPFPDNYGIAGPVDMAHPTLVTTASQSTIAQQAAFDADSNGNPVLINISAKDLDLWSAASRSAIVHKIHAAFAVKRQKTKYDAFIGLGGSWEFPQRNSALEVWELWAKIGAAF